MNTKPDMKQEMNALPGGTVTYLFTDIEGSTRLLQKLGDSYSKVLALQRQVFRSAIENWQGQEVDTQGDAFFVAFARASDAISAAAQAQELLAQQSWPGGMAIKVRMGLHTGEAKLTHEGYVGIDVHRAARICSAGHGGQILISPSTAALVMNNLPKGYRLHDLGEHRLKDLSHPEHLFQLDVPGLTHEFPVLKSLNALPNNLPMQLTSFIGRQDEIDQIKKMLSEVRLITITGPGGSGKSRLSIQVAAELVDQYPDGVWFVPLTSKDSIEDIPSAIASAFHYRIETNVGYLNPVNELYYYLSSRTMLLVLDNFEHLLAGAEYLKELLVKAPQIKLLITSRECLNIPEEWVFTIPGLSYPRNGHKNGNGSYTALVLFQERARQNNPTFSLTAAERPFVSNICRLVGGMPLAIELAAPWTTILSCREIAQEVEQNLDFLTDTLRGVPEGHRSLRAVFNHSWQLLNDSERTAFCNLAVFEGGFDRFAAQKVADIGLPMLINLVNKSLIQRGEGDRFHMHALLRQFATEYLQTNPAGENALRERHCRYYLESLIEWQTSTPGDAWLPALEKKLLDNGNFKEMIRWALIHWDEAEAGQALDAVSPIYLAQGFFEASINYQAVITFLRQHGACHEADTPRRNLLLKVLTIKSIYDASLGNPNSVAVADECVMIARSLGLNTELGTCLYTLGIFAEINNDNHKAIQIFEEALPLVRDSLYIELTAGMLLWLGWAYIEVGEIDKAKKCFDEAYQLAKYEGVGALLPYTLDKLGLWADSVDNFAQGIRYHQEALQSFKRLGAQSGQALALYRMSASYWGLGDFTMSLKLAQEGYECFKAIGHRWGMPNSLCRIGYAYIGLKNYIEAQSYILQGLKLGLEYHMQGPLILTVVGMGILKARQGEYKRAVELFTVATSYPYTPVPSKVIVKKEMVLLEEKLGKDDFAAAVESGKALDFLTVIDEFSQI